MTTESKLLVHCGGTRRERHELGSLPTPPPTETWRPVPHGTLVGELVRGLAAEGIDVVRDEYATSGRGDARLFGVMDLRIPALDMPDYAIALGLRGANDKSMAIQVIAAARVFVCDNMAFSGADGAVVLRKRHTSRLDLAAAVPSAVAQFLERADAFRLDIDRMKGGRIAAGRAKEIIHDAFAGAHQVLPLKLLPVVSRLYFDDEEQRDKFGEPSLWGLNNAFTEAAKRLRSVPRHHAGQRIGRYFGRLVRRADRGTMGLDDAYVPTA